MIEATEARAKVRAYLESDDFELVEFPGGWRVDRPTPRDLMGIPTLVVERSSGALLRFGSGVAPGDFVDDHFAEIRGDASRVDPPESG